MAQKQYEFPKLNGGPILKTLAVPTNKRLVEFLAAVGKSDFSELLGGGGQIEYGMFVLDLGVKEEKLRSMLDVCLEEGSADIDCDRLDLRVSDEVIQDFFEQRAERFLKRSTL